eukprot:284157-Chlamydomonas_euryale.AAC.3
MRQRRRRAASERRARPGTTRRFDAPHVKRARVAGRQSGARRSAHACADAFGSFSANDRGRRLRREAERQ